MDTPFWESRAIYLVRSGSHAYGTNVPTSDVDTRGVCIPPADYILGLKRFEQYEAPDADTTIYGLHKFVNLAMNCNPNIIELLHVRESEILHSTAAGERLRAARHLFVTKRAFKTFGGYAYAQLQQLKRGKTAKHGTHAEIVEEHGFDTKNALHLIRLLRMGVEVLRMGLVNVYRPDREELLAIRRGEWALEQVLAEADRLDAELKAAYEASTLPDHPDFDAANELVIDLTRRALEGYL